MKAKPKVTKRVAPGGSIEIRMDEFVVVQIHYHHRYCDSATRGRLSDSIVELLSQLNENQTPRQN